MFFIDIYGASANTSMNSATTSTAAAHRSQTPKQPIMWPIHTLEEGGRVPETVPPLQQRHRAWAPSMPSRPSMQSQPSVASSQPQPSAPFVSITSLSQKSQSIAPKASSIAPKVPPITTPKSPSASTPSYARYDWDKNARPNQRLPRGDWRTWLILAGRGFGKTRTGAESVRQLVDSGTCRRVAFIAQTLEEVRAVMIEGVSGLLEVYPPDASNYPKFDFRSRRVLWPNGAIGELFDAERPDRLRGPQFDLAWVDELAKFRRAETFFNQLSMTLRLGPAPRCIITTTPRPSAFLRRLIADPSTYTTRGSTFDNAANLPKAFLENLHRRFDGTRIGRQELNAEILEQTTGTLWTMDHIQYRRPDRPLQNTVVAIDPAMTRCGDETGIIVAGRLEHEGYVLDDASGRFAPHDWAHRAIDLFYHYGASRIIAEINQGGDLVEAMLRTIDKNIPYTAVRATHGKAIRAEPIVALYEQRRIFHVQKFPELERQMCSFEGNGLLGEGASEDGRFNGGGLGGGLDGGLDGGGRVPSVQDGFSIYGTEGAVLNALGHNPSSSENAANLQQKAAITAVSDDSRAPSTLDLGEAFEGPPSLSPDRMDALVWAMTELFALPGASPNARAASPLDFFFDII